MDASRKSKQYRDKIKKEIKELEHLLPLPSLPPPKKLDNQTIYRTTIAYFKTKSLLKAIGVEEPPIQTFEERPSQQGNLELVEKLTMQLMSTTALFGFLLIVLTDGTIVYVSENISEYLGIQKFDILQRCIYKIVHPDDHYELKVILENFPGDYRGKGATATKRVQFLCRIKCFTDNSSGFVKMKCIGTVRDFGQKNSLAATSKVYFGLCVPLTEIDGVLSTQPSMPVYRTLFWSKHTMDLCFKSVEPSVQNCLGYLPNELENESLYTVIHPHDVETLKACHLCLLKNASIYTLHFRLFDSRKKWVWLHSRSEAMYKNSRKVSITMSHCVLSEEDSSFLQYESKIRRENFYAKINSENQIISSIHENSAFEGSKQSSPTPGPRLGLLLKRSIKDVWQNQGRNELTSAKRSNSPETRQSVWPNKELRAQAYYSPDNCCSYNVQEHYPTRDASSSHIDEFNFFEPITVTSDIQNTTTTPPNLEIELRDFKTGLLPPATETVYYKPDGNSKNWVGLPQRSCGSSNLIDEGLPATIVQAIPPNVDIFTTSNSEEIPVKRPNDNFVQIMSGRKQHLTHTSTGSEFPGSNQLNETFTNKLIPNFEEQSPEAHCLPSFNHQTKSISIWKDQHLPPIDSFLKSQKTTASSFPVTKKQPE